MNDPHVVSLKYKLVTGETVAYNSPPAVTYSDPGFDLRLENDILSATMKEHHATTGSAMEKVRPVLRAWQIQASLSYGRDALAFEFIDAEVIDRNPPPPGTSVGIAIGTSDAVAVSESLKMKHIKAQYPEPPTTFKASLLVERLWARLQQHLDGKELLTSMAYACLTLVQAEAGKRSMVSARYGIHEAVLDKLGELTSDVGDELSARKFNRSIAQRPHTPAEQTWILEAVKMLIRRVAEYEFNPVAYRVMITLDDLPKL